MEIRTFLAPLLKWWWLILIAAALAGVSSYLAVRNEPDIYQARATLMIGRPFDNLNPDGNQFYLSQQLAGSYADIAKREPVRQGTRTALGLDILPEYDIRVPDQTGLIEIWVTDTYAARAQAVANEIAHQLVLLSPGGQDTGQQELAVFVDKQLSELAVKIEETQEEILIKEEELGEMFSAREIADTQDQILALDDKLNTLQAIYTGFLANSKEEATNVLTIVEPATIPQNPIGPNKTLIIAMSVGLGIALAALAAYTLEYIDDSIESEDDISQTVDLPVLASLEKNGTYVSYPALTMKSPRSPISESFRDLRTRVMFLSLNKPLETLLVTSANPYEGKSFTAANLAVVMAQAGYSTVLIDGDLRRPRQHEIFDLENETGLSNLIMEANSPDAQEEDRVQESLSTLMDDVIQETEQSSLQVLTSGTIPPNPSELIGSNGMIAVIEALREKFDYVIMDSSPCLVVTDSLLLATLADSVVVVSSANQTRGKDLETAVTRLEGVDANVVGVVLNRVPRSERSRYPYYQSHIPVEGETVEEEIDQEDKPDGGFRNRFLRAVTNNGTDQSQITPEKL